MERITRILIIVLSLIVFDINAADVLQQEKVVGKVVMNSSQKGVGNVVIEVDQLKKMISGADGTFKYLATDIPDRPTKVDAYRKGLETAAWEYDKGVLTVFMREATIRTLKGTLSAAGKVVANQMIVLKGENDFNFISDSRGRFNVKIPYTHSVNKNSIFLVNGKPLKIKNLKEVPERAVVSFNLELENFPLNSKLSKVLVVNREGAPSGRTIVTVAGESFITGEDGTFTVDNVSLRPKDWFVKGMRPVSIQQSPDSRLITVVLGSPGENATASNTGASFISPEGDTLENVSQIDHIFKSEINNLIDYYKTQADEIEERNHKITMVIDSLSKLTQLDMDKRDEYLNQVDELSQSLGITSDDFNELKSNSIVLIERLRTLLLEQEEKIRLIELEKEMQAKKFRNNLLIVLSVLGLASMLLIIVIFIARRISARKKVVERVKDQLAEAQEIAKIASMTYFIKSKQHEYSEHFFKLLGIKDKNRIKKIQRTSDQYINSELLVEDELTKVNEIFTEGLKTKEPISMEIKMRSDNDKELFVDLRAKVEESSPGKPVAISSTIQDITEKKEREFQLIEARNSAEKANQEKEDFLSTMSHEIRTPLNGIIGLTDHLINSNPPDHLVENLKTLKFSADHLLSLVNDVLDYNKIRAGKMVLYNKTFSLKEHMSNTVKAMSLIAQRKGIRLELDYHKDVPNTVFGDRVRLNQVITNLLNNAIKFTEDGTVTLSLQSHLAIDGKANILFNVKDTGIGIDSSKLDRIFESFEQEDVSTSNKHGGTGLGLAISRQLVKLFGGELFVRSEQGVGSEFYFTIPFKKIDEKEINEHENDKNELNEADFSRLKVLCVEDNEVNQLVISQYFENWKMKYSFAGTGAEAMEKYAEEYYDIVFMDINLPDQKGDQVVLKLKEKYPDRECSFVAMTADTGKVLQDAMKRGGMLAHLNKPFSVDELKSIIYKYGSKKFTNNNINI